MNEVYSCPTLFHTPLQEDPGSGTSSSTKRADVTATAHTVHPVPCSTAQSSALKRPQVSSVIALRSFPVGRQVIARAHRMPMARTILLKCTVCKCFSRVRIRLQGIEGSQGDSYPIDLRHPYA